jgi:hypothetical protein
LPNQTVRSSVEHAKPSGSGDAGMFRMPDSENGRQK